MREMIDCHVHTQRCGHATGTVAQMVGAAVFKGLSGVVMTEHLPLPDDIDPSRHLSMPADDLATYVDEVHSMAERVKGLQVITGAEVDWLPGREEYSAGMRRDAEALGIEVFLGSVHFIGDWAFDSPHDLAEWDRRDVGEVWEQYFSLWCDAASSGLFDVMAHPDLVKKFGHRPSFDTSDLYAEAARCAAQSGVMIEVSSAGLRKPVGEIYPGPELLSAFRAAGVEATAASDAHAPDEIGLGIEDSYAALHEAGYRQVAFPVGRGEVRYIEL
jgi:histidinol-phosphatase (PHP family)